MKQFQTTYDIDFSKVGSSFDHFFEKYKVDLPRCASEHISFAGVYHKSDCTISTNEHKADVEDEDDSDDGAKYSSGRVYSRVKCIHDSGNGTRY